MSNDRIASLILAAGKGSRMKDFEGNKTLLPLVPFKSPFEGAHPILLQIIASLPPGPKAVVIQHRKKDVVNMTKPLGVAYCEQPILNGTGGALIASREFLEADDCERLIITMGDVPFVKDSTYLNLIKGLEQHTLMVLGFRPQDKRQYGVLEIEGLQVRRIIEWEYWKTYAKERQSQLEICNSGIYAIRKEGLMSHIDTLEKRPHTVTKERDGRMVELQEFFITDLVELMHEDGLSVGYVTAEDEREVMGVDDLPSLIKAQEIFAKVEGGDGETEERGKERTPGTT